MKIKDMTGLKFGRLLGLRYAYKKRNRAYWEFVCDCGVFKVADGASVRNGKVKSCGCLHKEQCSENGKNNKTHGLSKTGKLYHVYIKMVSRCYNPSDKDFKNYGGRGIFICKEWSDINSFFLWARIMGYKDGVTIERKDVNGCYSPENCCWIENERQALNTRKVRIYDYVGRKLAISEISKLCEISKHTIKGRLNRGWSVDEATSIKAVIGRNQFDRLTPTSR